MTCLTHEAAAALAAPTFHFLQVSPPEASGARRSSRAG